MLILVGLGGRDFPQNLAILILFTHVFPLKATLGLFLRWTCSDSTFATGTLSWKLDQWMVSKEGRRRQ